MRLLRSGSALALAAVVAACNDTGTLAPIEPDPSELDPVVVCDGETFGELKYRDEVTDDCRERIEAIEREAPSDFRKRLIVLGAAEAEDGARTLYVNGADELGRAITTDAFSDARLEITGERGEVTELDAEALALAPLTEEDGALIAVAFVNDHSRTMRDEDLEAVSALEREVLSALPPGAEGSVTLFSTDVSAAEAPTDDRAALEAALAPSTAVTREETALYDAMSTGLEALLESRRPIRLLVVASDGPDNASKESFRTEVARTISANGITGFVAGALFADATEFRALFGTRGVVLLAPSMRALPPLASEYLASLGVIVKLTIPSDYASATRYRLVLGDTGVVVR